LHNKCVGLLPYCLLCDTATSTGQRKKLHIPAISVPCVVNQPATYYVGDSVSCCFFTYDDHYQFEVSTTCYSYRYTCFTADECHYSSRVPTIHDCVFCMCVCVCAHVSGALVVQAVTLQYFPLVLG